MGLFRKPRRTEHRSRRSTRRSLCGRGFEALEDRRLMAVVTGQSTFSASVFGDNIEALSETATVGYGYAINVNGVTQAATGGDGQARTAADAPIRSFNSLTELEVSSVSKTITATAILRLLQSQPGGLDAALSRPLTDFLPSDWNPGSNIQFITLRHLLTHSSGFSETSNAIGVNFESYGQNTFQNLQALVQAGLPAPNVPADAVYDGPRWNIGDNYNNANFTLLAKVVLPKLVNPGVDLTAANYANRDASSGAMYKQYVQDNVFEPMGIFGADLNVTDPNPAKGYNLATADVSPGLSQANLTNTGGAFGWKLSARELATFLDGIRRDNSILWASTRQMRDEQQLGWFRSADAFGEFYTHNGATGGAAGNFRSQIVAMPGNVEVSYLMNSEAGNLPGGSIGNMLKTAYVNAWTDLTVAGTTGDDNFVLRLNNSGFRPSIEVVLNGDVEFTHWIDTLDSLTLNGSLGNDTFTIEGWNPSIDLVINGSFGNDVVNVLPGVKNLELASGMTFNGGAGNDSIVINDQNNPYSNVAMSRLYTVGEGSVTRFKAHPAFPQNPGMFVPVTIGFNGVENLDVKAGGQYDTINVVSKTSGETIIRAGGGNDVITVAQNAGNIETVDGLEVDGQAGLDTIRLYDNNKSSNDPQASAQYDVYANNVARYMASLGGIADPNGPQPVAVDFDNVENLELTTTEIRDVIRVHATTSGQTTIHAGAGNDILNASPNAKNLEQVNDLVFNGGAGLDSIALNDQNNPYSHPALSRQYQASASGVSRYAAMAGNPIAIPVPVSVSFSSVEDLTLSTGGQNDLVNVESTPASGATVNTGAGDDVVHASPAAANLETVNGLSVNGGLGNDALHVHDENNPYEITSIFTITPSTVGRYAEHVLFDNVAVPVEMSFAGMESVALVAGDQQDRFNVEGTGSAASLLLDGNGGADQFNVASPAFTSINIQGDFPIFAPGDQLNVNEDGLYATAWIPGLYVAGSGALTLDSATISYSGIETTDVKSQIYGGPGDFDLNGLVNHADLTDPTLGWNARFGSDLDGRDFLTWQRHYGENRLPRDTRGPSGAGALSGEKDIFAPAAATHTPALATSFVALSSETEPHSASSRGSKPIDRPRVRPVQPVNQLTSRRLPAAPDRRASFGAATMDDAIAQLYSTPSDLADADWPLLPIEV